LRQEKKKQKRKMRRAMGPMMPATIGTTGTGAWCVTTIGLVSLFVGVGEKDCVVVAVTVRWVLMVSQVSGRCVMQVVAPLVVRQKHVFELPQHVSEDVDTGVGVQVAVGRESVFEEELAGSGGARFKQLADVLT
jgi:hypothetical protein